MGHEARKHETQAEKFDNKNYSYVEDVFLTQSFKMQNAHFLST